jgi:hypothetical protein
MTRGEDSMNEKNPKEQGIPQGHTTSNNLTALVETVKRTAAQIEREQINKRIRKACAAKKA